jgi:hypothetical protein
MELKCLEVQQSLHESKLFKTNLETIRPQGTGCGAVQEGHYVNAGFLNHQNSDSNFPLDDNPQGISDGRKDRSRYPEDVRRLRPSSARLCTKMSSK